MRKIILFLCLFLMCGCSSVTKIEEDEFVAKVSNLINELRDDMVQIISNINVNIDYPEYDDVEQLENEVIEPEIKKIKTETERKPCS